MKIRRISQFQGRISFLDFDSHFDKHFAGFLATDLGNIYSAIPWLELVKCFGLKEYNKGPACIFCPRGKLALMFLKNYSGLSDSKLIEQLNGNIHYQIFCNLILEPGQLITNFKIVSQIRCELATLLDIESCEKKLFDSWKEHMTNLDSITCDATCYQTSIKYPTDVKLLYDSVQWIYEQVLAICKTNKLRKPRTKIKKWTARSISFSKMKKKRKKKRISVTRGLLRLLRKLTDILDHLEKEHGPARLTQQYFRRVSTIKQILQQQEAKFYHGIRPKQAIVSIDKPYIRPIV